MTNMQRLQSMSDEELTTFLLSRGVSDEYMYSRKDVLRWLHKEAKPAFMNSAGGEGGHGSSYNYMEMYADWIIDKMIKACIKDEEGNKMTEDEKKYQTLQIEYEKLRKENEELKAQIKPFTPIVYISGPMKGIENRNRDAFNHAAQKMREQGFIVMNPAMLPDGLPEESYLGICIKMLEVCNSIFMLEGWYNSHGATCEYFYAKRNGYKRAYETWEGQYKISLFDGDDIEIC